MNILALSVVTLSFIATYVLGLRTRLRHVQEELDYYTLRDAVGDVTSVSGILTDNTTGTTDTSEAEVLRRRLAGLLASPRLYLRARRIVAPLTLDRDELTAELELIETA